MSNSIVNRWQFSPSATQTPPMEISDPRTFLAEKYDAGLVFGRENLQREGMFKLRGWVYDLRPFLKRYVVKQYGSWFEYYGPNKTLLRRSIYGEIEEIVEIKNSHTEDEQYEPSN